jgi:uncharacterized protein (TIGR03435 family)
VAAPSTPNLISDFHLGDSQLWSEVADLRSALDKYPLVALPDPLATQASDCPPSQITAATARKIVPSRGFLVPERSPLRDIADCPRRCHDGFRNMRLVGHLMILAAACTAMEAQSPDIPAWQTAAGGKMAFDVASVKLSKSFRPPLFPLDNRNAYVPGGRLSGTFPLEVYITFAYKLSLTNEQRRVAFGHLPKSVGTDSFDIEARAEGNPTKDQMRLMIQSLLADRFKLAVHFETREGPVFELTMVKPGKRGPKLRQHAEGPPCPDSLTPAGTPPSAGDIFPRDCETAVMWERKGVRMIGSRNTTMPLLADAISSYGAMAGEVDKPVVD